MIQAVAKRYPFTIFLVSAHFVACALFLLLRAPIPLEWQQDLDRERASSRMRSGISLPITDAYMGHIACRTLGSWSAWHGGESPAVKALEVVNLPAALATALASSFLDHVVLHYRLSFAQESWLIAVIFLVLSTAEWLVVGLACDAYLHRRHARKGV
jgi:hypothetical protein